MPIALRALIPGFLWRSARRTVTFATRIKIWAQVYRQIHGVVPEDQARIRRAALQGAAAAFKKLDEWHNPELLEDTWVDVEGVGIFLARAHCDDLFHVLPAREPEVMAVLEDKLRPGGVFIDAGANIGFFTVLGSRLVGDGGTVIAVEMMPETATALRNHIARNDLKNVTVVENALSDTAGHTVEAAVVPGKFGMASLLRSEGRKVKVETVTLDDILREVPHVDLMKMDIEGAEEIALRGAQEVLGKIAAIVFEQLDGPEVSDLLTKAGFKVTKIASHTMLAERA